MNETVRLLRDMVAIRSVNPMGRPIPGPGFGEGKMCRYVEDFLGGIGLKPLRQEVAPGRENVYVVIPGKNSARSMLFEAHMDTVSADSWDGDPFRPVIQENRLYGRGACDTKGSLAAMMSALHRLVREVATPPRTVIFLASCDEEFNFRGAAAFTKLGIGAAMAVVGEPTNLDPVIAHKGAVRWRIKCLGKSAHSAYPEHGVNAIYRMARVLLRLEEYNREVLGSQPPHPLLGRPTLSVGLIEGGLTVNTVPDSCVITVDRRVMPNDEAEKVIADVKCFLTVPGVLDFEPVFEPPFLTGGGMETPAEAEIVQRACRACRRVLGKAQPKGVSYGTNATGFSRAGIQCVVLGPGDIAQAHAVHEFVELSQVEAAAEIYFQMMSED